MRKILAIFLLLAMLVPMCVVTRAEAVAEKPFYLVNMTKSDLADTSNVYAMPIFYGQPIDKNNPIIKLIGGESYVAKATSLKTTLGNMPKGTRYFFFEALRVAFYDLVEDGVYMEKAVEVTKQWMESFLRVYKTIGGELDGIIIDLEYEPAKNWFIFEWLEKEDPYIYTKIVQNPKYQTLIRPHLVERGFKFYQNTTATKSEIYSIHPNSGAEYAQSRSIWDVVLRDLMNQYVNQACEPLFKYYPDAILTDYQSKSTKGWLKEIEKHGGGFGDVGNIVHTVGNRSSEDSYSERPSAAFFQRDENIAGYNNAIYENSPYNSFMMDANLFKNTYESADNGKVSFWITDYRFKEENPNSVSRTPYYAETVIHAAMLDPDPLLGYIIPSEVAGNNNIDDPKYLYAIEIVDDILTELTRVLGKADRKPIITYNDWNSKFYVSGMYAGGKNYWRVTPDTTVVSLKNFKVQGTDPTFSAAGKTITFPGGKIIADGPVREVGTCGYWVETDADVTPVVTAVDNYYYQYPAFEENFDQYKAGVELGSTTALPAGVWTAKKIGASSGTIQKVGNNGALAIKGNITLTNGKVIKNINAVDVYAKRQGWEVEVTVPADMASNAEIVLLSCVDNDGNADDVGMKIAGSKLCYDRGGRYMVMAGVTIEPGNKYTVKRIMNMTVDGAFTSDYYIYDASGSLLGSAKNIPLSSMTAPITSISMSSKNVTGGPVILDNYKLYLTDSSTNFELYDAANGMRVKDVSTARQKDTAYRLSWVNATSESKYYTVVAAYYNGRTLLSEQVVQTFKAAPNSDGVVTGIVKNENAGQTLRIYWKETEPPVNEEEIPDGNTPVIPDGSGAGSSTGNDAGSSTGSGTDSSTDSGTGPTIGDGTGPTIGDGAGSSTGDGAGSATGDGAGSSTGDSNNPAATEGEGTSGNVTNKPDNKPKKRGWIIAVAIPVILAVAGGAVYMVFMKKPEETAEETLETDEPSEE